MSRQQEERVFFLIDNMAELTRIRHTKKNAPLLHGDRLKLALYIARHTNKNGAFFRGLSRIEAETNICEKDLKQHLADFVAHGVLIDDGIKAHGHYRPTRTYLPRFERLLPALAQSATATNGEGHREERGRERREEHGREHGREHGEERGREEISPNPSHERVSVSNQNLKPKYKDLTQTDLESLVSVEHLPAATSVAEEVFDLVVKLEEATTKNVRNPQGFREHLRPFYASIIERLVREQPNFTALELARQAHDIRNDKRTPRSRSTAHNSGGLELLDVFAVIPAGDGCEKCGTASRCPLSLEVQADDPQCRHYGTTRLEEEF